MKKLFLLSIVGTLGLSDVSAQLLNRTSSVLDGKISETSAPVVSLPSGTLSTSKVTSSVSRRYDHELYSESISTTSFLGRSVPIWQDTTIRQNFTTGLGTINYSSVAQSFFPMDALWNDKSNPSFVGKPAITATNSYVVDSVRITGLYFIGTKGGASIVDTLVVSVAHQPASNWVGWLRSTSAWTIPYLPVGKDTLKTTPPTMVDSVKRMALCNPTTTANTVIRIPLTPSMRTPSTSTTFQEFKAKVPGTFTVPAGNIVQVSYTFRSGDTWVKNSDTVTERHHFRAGFAYPGTSTASEQQKYRYYDGDRSMSSMMFATDSNSYTATVVIGAINDPTRWFNQYLLNSITVSCASCENVGIKESTLFSSVKAFPNPANAELNIPFTAKEKSIVSISLINMIGQVVANQNVNVNAGQEATAFFNTSSLSSGVYLYTLEAKGQRISNRVSVVH